MRKIYVYTIAKNERKFVDMFMKSAGEADGVYILDTGSTDGTPERLRELGATVKEREYNPWRFDVARNDNLAMAPTDTDICVSFDMDELLIPGWRDRLEKAWRADTEQANYKYVWNYNSDGSEGVTFNREKIHKYDVFRWKHPVHEVLTRIDGKPGSNTVFIDGITCEHHADNAKPRSGYLPLLELSVEEDPADDRNMHYLGREYMYHRRWQDAINTLKRHLANPNATWSAERSASMRFIGRCFNALNYPYDALWWFQKAAAEAPLLREGWYEAAKQAFNMRDITAFKYFSRECIKIKERNNAGYIQESEPWSGEIERMIERAKLL
ncbi:MAG: glycosyl transferase family 2 [Oscillospiraceae bacterium]|jgi:glycosyltransferase involved in cell wall biosynthesis|nr:glycosyl transferase family 2 [Oscillospiraceae bacterium]